MRSRVHRRVHMDYIGVKRFDDDGQLIGEFRIVGLFTSTAYTRSTRSIPYLRRKVDTLMRRSGFDPDSHSGKALAAVLENYLARRAVPDRRGHALSASCSRSCISTSARACACWRGATASTASCRSWCSCRATATTPRRASRSATIWPAPTRAASRRSIRSSPKARWCACISSSRASAARRRTRIARRSSSAVEQLVRTWTDGLAEALTLVHEPIKAQQLIAPLPRRVSGRLPRGLCAAGRGRRHPADREPVADPPARRRLLQPARGRSRLRGPEGVEPREADPAVRARAGAGEHGLPGRRRAHLPDRAGRCRRGRGVAARHDAGARRRRGVRSRSAEGAARGLLHGGDARPRRERRLQRAGADRGRCSGATSRWCARSRASCARSASPIRRTTCGRRCGAMPASRRRSCSCSTCASIRGSRSTKDERARAAGRADRRDRDRARRPSKASTRTASCAISSTP